MGTIFVHVVKRGRGRNLGMRYRCPVTRKFIERTTGTTSISKAEQAAIEWQYEIRNNLYHKPGRMGWEEFKERYREQVAREKSPRTAEKVESMFNVVESVLRPQRLSDITKESLAVLKRELLVGRATSTVHGYLAYLRAALNAAAEWGALEIVPKFPKVRTPKGTKLMKGRPITLEEFERMLAAAPKVVHEQAAPSWQFLPHGLWCSGLRLGEACALYWTGSRGHLIDLSGRYPMLLIQGELEKGKKDRLLPMAPEFAQFLDSVPAEARRGRVFAPIAKQPGAPTPQSHRIGEIISAIGKMAVVVVDSDPYTGAPKKYATAHDLRRAFGQRWAHRVPAATLMELMRHESIETTKKFYIGENADATAAVLWQAAGLEKCDIRCDIAEAPKPPTPIIQVDRAGFEPATPAFSVQILVVVRSWLLLIHLFYRPLNNLI
jgi:integrase